jgi:hypothetical protein
MIKALRREIMIVLIVFLLGVIVGWLVLGWLIAPVVWTEAAPAHLRDGDFRPFHLQLLARAFQSGSINAEQLVQRGIGQQYTSEALKADLDQLAVSDQVNASSYQALYSAVEAERARLAAAGGASPGASVPGGTSPLLLLGVALAIIVVAFLAYQVVRRANQSAQTQAVPGPGGFGRPAPAAPGAVAWPGEVEAPLKQFDMMYVLGDDRFDMSNAIENPDGMFLGECGMGISETIGVGNPDKVTAFEVWLFDKNDIRTVTTVLMSEHAFHDSALRAKLAPKGDAALAQMGDVITLSTAALRVRAKVVDMEYGTGGLPDRSFFSKLHVSMAAWQVGDSGITQPAPAI